MNNVLGATDRKMAHLGSPGQGLLAALGVTAVFIGTFMFGVSQGMREYLSFVGIIPLNWHGLTGIALSPFGHANTQHLIVNIVPLMFLTYFLVLLRGFPNFFALFCLAAFGSGLFTWLITPPTTLVVGVSGVVSALAVYLCITSGLHKDFTVFAISAMLTTIIIMSILSTIVSAESTSSWQAHIGGLLTGVILACLSSIYSKHRDTYIETHEIKSL